MNKSQQNGLSRRERQIMDIVYQKSEASAAEVRELLPDPPSYSSVRALLRVLVDKGLLKHHEDGPRYVYRPVINREKAKRSALQHVMKTFFDNSTENVVSALMELDGSSLSDDELDRLSGMIDRTRQEGR